MIDMVIKGGTVVDGTGAKPFTADVAVDGGRIVAVGSEHEAASTVVDADGALVLPGWVDAHTHYDGQVTWDDELEGSVSNGVTTVVMGNCGVGFAPARAESTDVMIDFMEGVEDIPGTALYEGIPWGSWESFPEYLDFLRTRRMTIDIGAQLPHAALRYYVMQDRAITDDDASDKDLAAMTALTEQAMRAGAMGFSTGRFSGHISASGRLSPGVYASEREVLALARATAAGGATAFQAVPAGVAGFVPTIPVERFTAVEEVALMARISRETGLKVNFTTLQSPPEPQSYKQVLAAAAAENSRGAALYPMVASRGLSGLTSLQSYHIFVRRPTYLRYAHLPLDELVAVLRQPEIKAAILAESDVPSDKPGAMENAQPQMFAKMLGRTFPLTEPVNYEPSPEEGFAALAAAQGRDPIEFFYDFLLEKGGTAVAVRFHMNYVDGNLDACREMLVDPNSIWGLDDAGAHVQYVCDMSFPTFNLTYWVRDRQRGERIPLETVVAKSTGSVARAYGLSDRGTVAVGKRADLNIVDFERLTSHAPELRHDLPAGGRRFLQPASGYVATMVNGTVVRAEGKDTGLRPGRLVSPNG